MDETIAPEHIIPIHFDVSGHHLNLETFIETAERAARVAADINHKLLDGNLRYEVFVLPPRGGTFLANLLITAASVGGPLLAFVSTEVGRKFVEGLTGQEPAYWAELAGRRVREAVARKPPLLPPDFENGGGNEIQRQLIERHAGAAILAEAAKSFLQKDASELKRIGVAPHTYRDAYEARNEFYLSCVRDLEVNGVGFDETANFPIKRVDFLGMRVDVPPKDNDPEARKWHAEIATLTVTSPNWVKDDTQRDWKGKDWKGRNCFFKVEDEEFWQRVRRGQLHTATYDRVKVQWAFRLDDREKKKDAKVLRVLEYNGETLASPLDDNALAALLGTFNSGDDPNTPGLFDTQRPPLT